jgi:YHS domain-containing protein
MRLLAYLFDFIVFIVIGRLVGLILSRLFGKQTVFRWGSPGAASRQAHETRQGETVRDPVCGMFVSTEVSHQLKQDGKLLHFCSQECLERYQKEVLHVG